MLRFQLLRRAMVGSTLAARRAGMYVASTDTATIASGTMQYTPAHQSDARNMAPKLWSKGSANASPSAAPIIGHFRPLKHHTNTCLLPAPKATRIPISWVR
jgi:hypothetical protein